MGNVQTEECGTRRYFVSQQRGFLTFRWGGQSLEWEQLCRRRRQRRRWTFAICTRPLISDRLIFAETLSGLTADSFEAPLLLWTNAVSGEAWWWVHPVSGRSPGALLVHCWSNTHQFPVHNDTVHSTQLLHYLSTISSVKLYITYSAFQLLLCCVALLECCSALQCCGQRTGEASASLRRADGSRHWASNIEPSTEMVPATTEQRAP